MRSSTEPGARRIVQRGAGARAGAGSGGGIRGAEGRSLLLTFRLVCVGSNGPQWVGWLQAQREGMEEGAMRRFASVQLGLLFASIVIGCPTLSRADQLTINDRAEIHEVGKQQSQTVQDILLALNIVRPNSLPQSPNIIMVGSCSQQANATCCCKVGQGASSSALVTVWENV